MAFFKDYFMNAVDESGGFFHYYGNLRDGKTCVKGWDLSSIWSSGFTWMYFVDYSLFYYYHPNIRHEWDPWESSNYFR